jgi:hypothetical protein
MEQLTHPTTDMLDKVEEEILTCTASDEAVEAAAGTERGAEATRLRYTNVTNCCIAG